MNQYLTITVFLCAVPATGDSINAKQQYAKLLDEFEEQGEARSFAKRFLKFADDYAKSPQAFDALLWVVSNVKGRAETDTALKEIAKRHYSDRRLAESCRVISQSRSAEAEPLLRKLIQSSPHKDVQAHACYSLAKLLEDEARIVAQLTERPDLSARMLQYYGKEYGKHLSALVPAELEKSRLKVLAKLASTFAVVDIDDTTMGQWAEKTLFRLQNLVVGKIAPEIVGQDVHGKTFKLSDHRGKVVMLTFWGHW